MARFAYALLHNRGEEHMIMKPLVYPPCSIFVSRCKKWCCGCNMCIEVYIYRERERERHFYVYIYIYSKAPRIMKPMAYPPCCIAGSLFKDHY